MKSNPPKKLKAEQVRKMMNRTRDYIMKHKNIPEKVFVNGTHSPFYITFDDLLTLMEFVEIHEMSDSTFISVVEVLS